MLTETELDEMMDEIVCDMLNPIPIYSVHLKYWDGATRLFTFEYEEMQTEFVEYCREHYDQMCIQEMTMFESLLNYTEQDYNMFKEAH
jgi:hypothetical protein